MLHIADQAVVKAAWTMCDHEYEQCVFMIKKLSASAHPWSNQVIESIEHYALKLKNHREFNPL